MQDFLDDQIEGVQAQLAELYYKDQYSSVFNAFFISFQMSVMVNNMVLFSRLLWLWFLFHICFPYAYMLFDESKGGEK